MLMDSSSSSVPAPSSRTTPAGNDVDMMDGYGDAPANVRTTGGGVDFFSSLGTERKKKPKPDPPNPDKVGLKYPSPYI